MCATRSAECLLRVAKRVSVAESGASRLRCESFMAGGRDVVLSRDDDIIMYTPLAAPGSNRTLSAPADSV